LVKGPDFKRWRKLLGWSQKHAAEQLGLKRRVVQYYEKGERGGQLVKIPRTVRLACYALTLGASDYHGPPKSDREDEAEPKDRVRRSAKVKSKDGGDVRSE
jgi:transcriptional regulator with XRE-family HTH domain